MRKFIRTVTPVCALLGTTSLLAGCAPSVQPPTNQASTAQGVISNNGLQVIATAVELGAQAKMYKLKSDVTLVQGSLHSDFSVYGSINAPDKASLSFHENNFNISFYQQGQVAYSLYKNQWGKDAPLQDVDVFLSYEHLVEAIHSAAIPVYQLADQFDVNQYCHVYRVTVPGGTVAGLSTWTNGYRLPAMSNVQYTFFIGIKNQQLQEVQSTSVGSVDGMGAVQVNSDTVLFDLGSNIAAVSIPNDLVKQLENATS